MGSIYRSRLEGKPSDETARFVSSLVEDVRIFEDDLDGTEAHDIMLHEQGLLSLEELAKILGSLEKLRREWAEGRLKLEGEYEDVHELVEAYVIRDVGPEFGGKLHSGRSRNDQVATDIRMRLRSELLTVSQAVLDLVGTCLSKAEAGKATPMLLYTHTQQAQVGTFGHYLLAYAEAFLRDFQRLQDCYDRVNHSPLGAGPAGGTSIPIDRHRTALLLGFDGLIRNSLDATSSRDFMVEAMACLANLMVDVSRVVEDLILWSSSEFGFVELAEEFASVSSIMPQKKNPTVLELIRGKSNRVTGNLVAILGILKSLPSGYSSDLQETKPLLWDSLDQTLASLRILTKALASLTINEDKMAEVARGSYVFAVDLAERLTLEGLLPFRQAHALVGNLVREMVSRGLEPGKLTPELIEATAEKVLGQRIQVPKHIVEDVTDPRKCLARRSSLGSPNPEHVEHMLQESRELVSRATAALVTRRERLESSKAKLSETVNMYMRSGEPRRYKIDKSSALIVVDVQRDFCPGGSLAVNEGDKVVPVLNEYARMFHGVGASVYATRDWHSPNHISFKARGGPWPPHCVQGTEGAAFPPDLKLPSRTEVISKAMNPDREAYSGFDGTDLAQRLKEKKVKRVFVGGLATDYCVKNTVLDALKEGFETVLLTDAIRGVEVEPGDSERAVAEMVEKGAKLAQLDRMRTRGKEEIKK
jgi:argininosuccinate lyase